MYTHILLATDGSELATRAAEQGLALAKALSARVTILTVVQPLHVVAPAEVMITLPAEDYDKHAKDNAEKILKRLEASATDAGVHCTIQSVHTDDPWQGITETAAAHGCDLIVMGSHGRAGFTKFVLGSETQKVLAHTKIPVLVIR